MAHAVVDLLIVQCLEVHSERLQPGRLVSVMVDEVDVVLPEVLFRKVVGLYCANRCLARQDSSDQPGTNAACAYRIGEPCRVATDHVPVRDQTIVLVSHRTCQLPVRLLSSLRGVISLNRSSVASQSFSSALRAFELLFC